MRLCLSPHSRPDGVNRAAGSRSSPTSRADHLGEADQVDRAHDRTGAYAPVRLLKRVDPVEPLPTEAQRPGAWPIIRRGADRSTVIDWTAIAAASGSIGTLAGTLIGTFGGFRFASRNDEARDRRADWREAAARRAVLAERLKDERHAIQRDTLLELQDVLLDLCRWCGLVADADAKALAEHGKQVQGWRPHPQEGR
jgi:hypothetical protein